MGLVNQLDLDDWDTRQRADYARTQRITTIKLPCCGMLLQVDPGDGTDQYVTCTNKNCPKRTKFNGARHLLTWSLIKTQVQSERPMVEL